MTDSTTQPEIVNITIEQAHAIIADFKAKGKPTPYATPHLAHGHWPWGSGILGWDFFGVDGKTYRAPPTAICWVPHERSTWPFRYVTIKGNVAYQDERPTMGGDQPKMVQIPIGTRVKIVMVSKFGDVGITQNLEADFGYITRVAIDAFDELFENPSMEP